MRPDGTDSRFPVKRMPMGLLEHMVNFFNASSIQQVSVHTVLILIFAVVIVQFSP